LTRQRVWSVGTAVTIVAIGLWVQRLAGAGSETLMHQAGGAGLGLIGAWALSRWGRIPSGSMRWAMAAVAVVLLAAPLVLPGVQGVHRWIGLGPVAIQPLPLAVPVLVWLAAQDDAREPGWLAPGMVGLGLAALILAAHPDRQGSTAVLVASLALMFPLGRRDGTRAVRRWLLVGLALVAWMVTSLRPVDLAPVPYVEGVLQMVFARNGLSGLLASAALLGSVLLIAVLAWVPARDGPSQCRGLERCGWLLSVTWAAFVLVALGGDYPIPVIGQGAAWVLGWGLTLGLASASQSVTVQDHR
jgi:Bacterial cell division membrane protein